MRKGWWWCHQVKDERRAKSKNFVGPGQRCERDRPEEKREGLPRWDGQGLLGEFCPGPKGKTGRAAQRNRPERSVRYRMWTDIATCKPSEVTGHRQAYVISGLGGQRDVGVVRNDCA